MKRVFNKKGIVGKIITGVLIIILALITYASISIYTYGEKNYLGKADAAIVLGAAVWEDEPSPVFEERIKHGIWLYKNGYVKKIIFTGGKSKEDELSEAVVAKNYAVAESVPEEDILLETQSKITQENLYFSKQVADKNDIKSFIIVSDPLHMKRAMLLAEDYEMESYPSPTPTTRYTTWKSKMKFLAREVFYYIGYLFYRLI